jgi:hypothetical protein
MNNFQCSQSDREQFRIDFSDAFLLDLLDAPQHGKDPRNHIGLSCGFCFGRALQIGQDRILADILGGASC